MVEMMATTIHDVLIEQAARIPDHVLIEFGEESFTYLETARTARRFSSQLAELGVRPGDKVGIMLPNVPEFLFAYYGALMSGATVVLYKVTLTAPDIEQLARHSETRVMVVQDRLLPALEEVRDLLPGLDHVVVVGGKWIDAHQFDEIIACGNPEHEPAFVGPDDLAHLIYTSGTTGTPKGAMILHRNVLANLASISQMRPPRESRRVLCVLPLFHAYGLGAVLNATVMRGGVVCLHPQFEAARVIEALATRGVTTFAGTPTMYSEILNHPSSEGAKFPSLERAGSGGAPLPVEVRNEFSRRFGVEITEGYGMSEATVSLLGYPVGLPIRSGSVGVPLPSIDVRVVTSEGMDCQVLEVGEIICRGGNIMHGYFRNPEATSQVLRDGWLHTGDMGYVDQDGYFYIVDRMNDVIVSRGQNIYPREIEEVLYRFPGVSMAAVIGVPESGLGERVLAFILPKPNAQVMPDEISALLALKLTKHQLPERVYVVKSLPIGPTGKILKRVLRRDLDAYTGGSG